MTNKFEFTHKQGNTLLECLDITIKELGLAGVYRVTELATLVRNPVSENETHYQYEIGEDQVGALKEAMDITIKVLGLKSADQVLELLNILDNPPVAEAALEQAE